MLKMFRNLDNPRFMTIDKFTLRINEKIKSRYVGGDVGVEEWRKKT